jgi:hypothetical protein
VDVIREDVAVNPSSTSIDRIDEVISVAHIALGVARRSFEHCPSAENERRVNEAEADIDRMLDARIAAALR